MYKSLLVVAAAVASASAFAPAPRSAISRTVVRALNIDTLERTTDDWDAEIQKVNKEAPEGDIGTNNRWSEDGTYDWDAEMQKIKKEAEDRLEKTIEELMANIETVGQES